MHQLENVHPCACSAHSGPVEYIYIYLYTAAHTYIHIIKDKLKKSIYIQSVEEKK